MGGEPIDGMTYDGRVLDHRSLLKGRPVLQLFSDQIAAEHTVENSREYPVGGLSGAPVVVDGSVVGVTRFVLGVKHPQAGTFYATPISKILASDAASLLPPSDPFRGLPPLPLIDPPAQPFRYLAQYQRQHAPVFFGRGWEIRALYDALTAPSIGSPPIIFLTGQSGVGKSSLLTAGLFPRLENEWEVKYFRRSEDLPLHDVFQSSFDPKVGWAETENRLKRPLCVAIDQAEEPFQTTENKQKLALKQFMGEVRRIFGDPVGRPQGRLLLAFRKEWFFRRSEDLPLHDVFQSSFDPKVGWAETENRLKRPLCVAIDQAEEPFQTTENKQKLALKQFMGEVRRIFGDPVGRPQGRLLLAFRKEWLQDWDKIFREYAVHYGVVRIDPLTSAGIGQVVQGLASSERLRNFYRIEQVDPELVRELATRLSSDKQASVSPILQIWMTELWKDAQESSVDARSLTFKGFRELKLEELSIRNFLYQQLQKLRPPANEHLASGLVHDFLSFHVSTRGDSQVASASQKEEFYIDPERRTADIVFRDRSGRSRFGKFRKATKFLSH